MLLRFFLLILLIRSSTSATNDELKEELRLVRQDIGLLKVENKNQGDQITFLKGMVESQNKIIDEKIVEELNKKMKDCAMSGDESLSPEQKQLFRIIPSVHADIHTNNCRLLATVVYDGVFKSGKITLSGSSTTSPGRFYGQPTSCSDLSQLGYTLNGFYVVKSNNESTNSGEIKLDNVFCAFKQPEGTFNSSLVEKRIISRRETNSSNSRMQLLQATRKTDLVANYGSITPITFDNVLINSGDAFNAPTGMLTIPKTGLYLFIFRGMITYPQSLENVDKHVWIYLNRNGEILGKDYLFTKDLTAKSELDKLFKVNRGDIIMVAGYFYEMGAKISGGSTSFSAYFMEE